MRKTFLIKLKEDEGGSVMTEFALTVPIYLLILGFILSLLQFQLVAYISGYANFDGARTAMALMSTADAGERRIRAELSSIPLSRIMEVKNVKCTRGAVDTVCSTSIGVKYLFGIVDFEKVIERSVTLPTETAP